MYLFFYDKEDESIFSTHHDRHWKIGDWIYSWLNIGPSSFSNRYSSCGWADRIPSLWFCFGLWSALQNHLHSFLTHILRTASQRSSCSLSSLLLESGTNLFKPWEILTHEWESSLFTDLILISTIYLPCKQTSCNFQYGPIFGVPSDPNLSVQMYLRLLAKCTHDRPLHLWIVRILQCLLSWSTVRLQQHSDILHSVKNCSICLVVKAFQFASPYCWNRISLWARSSQSKSTSVLITLGTNEELNCPLTTGLPVLSG